MQLQSKPYAQVFDASSHLEGDHQGSFQFETWAFRNAVCFQPYLFKRNTSNESANKECWNVKFI